MSQAKNARLPFTEYGSCRLLLKTVSCSTIIVIETMHSCIVPCQPVEQSWTLKCGFPPSCSQLARTCVAGQASGLYL